MPSERAEYPGTHGGLERRPCHWDQEPSLGYPLGRSSEAFATCFGRTANHLSFPIGWILDCAASNSRSRGRRDQWYLNQVILKNLQRRSPFMKTPLCTKLPSPNLPPLHLWQQCFHLPGYNYEYFPGGHKGNHVGKLQNPQRPHNDDQRHGTSGARPTQ